jgi:hypothetical protein
MSDKLPIAGILLGYRQRAPSAIILIDSIGARHKLVDDRGKLVDILGTELYSLPALTPIHQALK